MQRNLILVLIALTFAWASPAYSFNFIKGQSDYLNEVSGSNAASYRMAFIENLIDFIVDRHGLTVGDWIEARGLAMACDANPTMYGINVPADMPGFAGDKNGANDIADAQKLRRRISHAGWTFMGYSGCGETVNFEKVVMVRTPASGNDPEVIRMHKAELTYDSGARLFTYRHTREVEQTDGSIETRMTTLPLPVITDDTFNTILSVYYNDFKTTFEALETGITVDIADVNSNRGTDHIRINPHPNVLETEWMRTIARGVRLGSAGYTFTNGIPVTSAIDHAISLDGTQLHLDVTANGPINRANINSRYYVVRTANGNFTIHNSVGGAAVATLGTTGAVITRLRGLL